MIFVYSSLYTSSFSALSFSQCNQFSVVCVCVYVQCENGDGGFVSFILCLYNKYCICTGEADA